MGNFNRGRSDGGRGFERRGGFGDRGSRGPVQMHQAVCDNCKKSCEVPFRPTSGKPIFCSDCFGGKKEGGSKARDQFEQLNSKLDQILALLSPAPKAFVQAVVDETIEGQPEEPIVEVKKKRSSKKS